MMSQPRRPRLEYSPPQEPQISQIKDDPLILIFQIYLKVSF